MSSVVTFWRLPEEEADLVGYLLEDPAIMAVTNPIVDSPAHIVWKPLEQALREKERTLLITHPELIAQMKLVYVGSEGVRIAITSAPALLYKRGRFLKRNQLLPTTLQVNTSYLADDGKTTIDLPSDYIRWGKRVLQWARRSAPNRFKNYRITPKAEAARQAGMEMVW
jgi:hypothetical protein